VLPVFYPPVLGGINLSVGGIAMPPIVVAEAPVEEVPPVTGFVGSPPVEAPIYVPPQLPRKPDRY